MCLMGGAEHNACGNQSGNTFLSADAVAAEIKAFGNLSGSYGICGCKTSHTGSGNDTGVWQAFQTAVDQHGFFFCQVKGFADNVRIKEQFCQVMFGYPDRMRDECKIRCDFQ